jgi:hypothetical protein
LLSGLPDPSAAQLPEPPAVWDTYSDTWAATDALGRSLPAFASVGPPRADRTVGIFYFLWHGAHVRGGPYDVTKILQQDPDAMQKADSPLWGPLHAPHHWGESIFGYYLSDDDFVLRKHAQMLSDAGVDVVIFDVTNQVTYKPYYMALLRVFSAVRQAGGRTPQVAFLCPFWDPPRVVAELYRDLYEPGLYAELWFRWEGKPLILADPTLIADVAGSTQRDTPARLESGHTLGQSFAADRPIEAVAGSFPTWAATDSATTLTLCRDGPQGERLLSQRFDRVADNGWLSLRFDPPLRAGTYYLEMSAPAGTVGWWSHGGDVFPGGQALADGQPVAGDRMLRISLADGPQAAMRRFFTFRKPQPDYFQGPTGPDMWSWLEVFPQHVFYNARGEQEHNYYYQMVAHIRRYKGVRPLPPIQPAPITVDGRFDDWSAVGPEFHDTVGDPARRNHPGYGSAGPYTDTTGRNDLVAAKLSYDADRLYFLVRTREPLTPCSDPHWMQLFLDADCDVATGWLGYDFVVHRLPPKANVATLERWNAGCRWERVAEIEFRTAGCELELSIPRSSLGPAAVRGELDFKWADNVQPSGDASDFTLHGDAAPNDRFNYRAILTRPQSK